MNHRLYQSSARAIGTETFFFRPSSEHVHGGFDVLGCECELLVGYFEDGSFNRDDPNWMTNRGEGKRVVWGIPYGTQGLR
jgi:hypothetical protein